MSVANGVFARMTGKPERLRCGEDFIWESLLSQGKSARHHKGSKSQPVRLVFFMFLSFYLNSKQISFLLKEIDISFNYSLFQKLSGNHRKIHNAQQPGNSWNISLISVSFSGSSENNTLSSSVSPKK